MDFFEYHKIAMKEKDYGVGTPVVYPALGLAGETGEVVEKIKKCLRQQKGDFTKIKDELKKELGDILWYITAIADDLNINLNFVAHYNIVKITSRREQNLIRGEGDNRELKNG